MSQMRKAYCCVVCDAEIWEPLSRWIDGPLEGEIRDAKRPLPGARRLTVAMLWSGNRANLSVCGDCDLTAENVAEVWGKILARDAMERDEDFRRALQPTIVRPSRTPQQQEWSDKMKRVTQMDMPVVVLSEQNWMEIHG